MVGQRIPGQTPRDRPSQLGWPRRAEDGDGALSVLDPLIVIAVALGAYAGRRRGFVRPVITQAGTLAALGLLYSRPDLLGGLVGSGIASIAVGLGIVIVLSMIAGTIAAFVARYAYRVPGVKKVDPLLGVVLSGLLTFVTVYVVLAGLTALDGTLTPIHRVTAIGPGQVAGLRARVQANPAASVVLDDAGLQRLNDAARSAPVPIASLGDYEPIVGAYELQVRPQMTHSALLPIVLATGRVIPFFGVDLPAPTDVPRDQPPTK